ncbi:MAG: hypothetical protein FJY75_04225, partial [Candidatus Eisenbacteria bacterium]|nr:hypothetical protein [Candidatus Eisenbacteria bacterium]
MSSFARTLTVAILAAAMLPAWTAVPAGAEVHRLADATGPTGMALLSESAAGVEVAFRLDAFRTEPLLVDGEVLQTISLSGVILPNDPGAPNLPGQGRFIALPRGARASVEIVSARTHTFADVAVAPAAPLPKETDDSPPV